MLVGLAGAQAPNLRTWQAEDGLFQNAVYDMVQTDDGYLWLGTAAGLLRFDGIAFVRYASVDEPGLAGDRISDLLIDHQGRLWIGTDRGVSVLENGGFRAVTEDVRVVEGLALDSDGVCGR